MSFVIYDLLFLAIFIFGTVLFLYIKRDNLKRQGMLYLYPTKIGINLINSVTKKYGRLLKSLEYVVLTCGYVLMVTIVIAIFRLAYNYITSPTLARDIKAPIIFPLVPYIDQIFKIDFLPPLYFTYWIIIIAIIAIPHEFAHGIFAKLNKITVHSTGFGFLGPFLAAFVEPDEKKMDKASKKAQLSVLAAGTFANVLMTILSAFLIWLFFVLAFVSNGVYFNTYATSAINVSEIQTINGIPLDSFIYTNESVLEINTLDKKYFTSYEAFKTSIENNLSVIYAFDDSPAYNAKLSGAIYQFGDKKVTNYDELKEAISSSKPGDNITIKTQTLEGPKEFNLQLAERDGKAYLGIGRIDPAQYKRGLLSTISIYFYKVADPLKSAQIFQGVSYESKMGDFGIFIYNLLWWLVIINLSVALMNMLPLGIFDGGKFFMISVWGITGRKKLAEKAFKVSTWLFLAILAAMMVKWVFAIF